MEKWGVQTFFSLAPLANPVLYPHLKIRGAAPGQPRQSVSTHLLIHLSAHLCHHPHSHHPSLLHSFTPGSKPTFSTNPSHLTTSSNRGLPSRSRDQTGLTMLLDLFFSSFFFNYFSVCPAWQTKLATRQLSAGREIHNIVSYRIPEFTRVSSISSMLSTQMWNYHVTYIL